MMNIHIIAVGKLKEKYLTEGCKEYLKRLGTLCKINIIEVDEYKLGDNPKPSEIDICLKKEGENILSKIPKNSAVIPLCIEGKQMPSIKFADLISKLAVDGISDISFIIGGSYGIWDEIKNKGKYKLSMSEMTFPHQLARLMLLEQIYRAFSITSGTKYHK